MLCSFKKGFSLLEVILSLGIVITLAAIVTPSIKLFQYGNEVNIAENVIRTQLNQARTYALARFHDSDWSVEIDDAAATVILFEGSSKTSAPTATMREIELPKTIELSRSETFQFEKGTGILIAGSSSRINIDVADNSDLRRSIRVQEYGLVLSVD